MNVSNIQKSNDNPGENPIRNTPNDQNSAVTQLFQGTVSSSSSSNDVNLSMPSKATKINLQNFTYIYPDAPDYSGDKNNRLIDFIRHRLDDRLDFTKISCATFLEIINEVHKIICADTDVSDRLDRSMVINHDYGLLVALNYETVVAEASDLQDFAYRSEDEIGYRSLYLKACGFPEKAAAFSIAERELWHAMNIVASCLSKHAEQDVKKAIDNQTIMQMARKCPPPPNFEDTGKIFAVLGIDKIDRNDPNAINAFFHQHRDAIAKHQQEMEKRLDPSPQKIITVNRLAMHMMSTKQFESLQAAALPVMHFFAQPKVIPLRLKAMFVKLQKNMREGVNIYDTVAELHCDYIDIHPKHGSTKRVARALMNLILVSKGYQPILFKAGREMDAYYEALLQQIHYSLAGAKDKSLYKRKAFATLLRNKAEMTDPEFDIWFNQVYPHSQFERAFQLALNYFKTPQNLMNKLVRLKSNPPGNDFASVTLEAKNAQNRLARMLANQTSAPSSIPKDRSNNLDDNATPSKQPATTVAQKSVTVNATSSKAASTTSTKSGTANFGGLKTGFFL